MYLGFQRTLVLGRVFHDQQLWLIQRLSPLHVRCYAFGAEKSWTNDLLAASTLQVDFDLGLFRLGLIQEALIFDVLQREVRARSFSFELDRFLHVSSK